MANKWAEQLKKLDGAVKERVDRFSKVIRTPSPSVNFIYGKTHGLPLGYSTLLWGPPGGGKSLLTNATIGQLHRDDPEAIVIKFDTEFRDDGQMSVDTLKSLGVDLDRYIVFEVNRAGEVFDTIAGEINAMCQKGAPVKMVIVDSINGIQGRREAELETVEKHTIGDHAMTMQVGLKKILPVQRRNNFHLVLCCQQRAEMDMLEQKRGNKTKAAASFGVLHHCEYFVHVERNKNKAGRTDELGNAFENEARKDVSDTADITGHKVAVWMQKSSVGPAGRSGEFTIDYANGVVNQHEEVFRLGTRWGIIERINNTTYSVDGKKFTGKPALLNGLRDSVDLQKFVVKRLLEEEKNSKFQVGSGPSDNILDAPTDTDDDVEEMLENSGDE